MSIQTTHPRVVQFYKDNPAIDFDTINLSFIDMFETISMTTPAIDPLQQSINTQLLIKQILSTQQKIIIDNSIPMRKPITFYKSGFSENNNIENVLNRVFDTAEITISTTPDTYIMKRNGKPNIIIGNKDCDRNITSDEIKEFMQNMNEAQSHGIFLSQSSGITSKPNYHIETHQGRLCVFVHKVEYSGEKINAAVDIVDQISLQLINSVMHDTKSNTISSDILDEINREYQAFYRHKETILNILKETHKTIIHQMNDLKFTCLDKYLSTKYTSTQTKGHKCELCKSFTASSLKAMAAHRRGCLRKQRIVPENVLIKNH